MHERYLDRSIYFKEQSLTTNKYVIPFIDEFIKVDSNTRVLEIGCGEGGNLPPFLEIGCECVGVDINETQINHSREYLSEYIDQQKYDGIAKDIYLLNSGEGSRDIGKFDLIVMRDVIEHIHNQEKFMGHLKKFLKPNGKIFFGFPPWQMPFGGHQQVAHGKASKLPWIHLLPNFLYFRILKWSGNVQKTIDDLAEIKETGITIERFRRIAKNNGYKTDKEQLWLINPNYEIKFKLKPRKQLWLLGAIPYFRNFFTTCNYTILSLD